MILRLQPPAGTPGAPRGPPQDLGGHRRRAAPPAGNPAQGRMGGVRTPPKGARGTRTAPPRAAPQGR
eukprot:12802799-Alexandrium_andersonii.AAC.1